MSFLNVFTIYGHGGDLGHMTCIIYINFLSQFLRKLHIKFELHWPTVSEKMFKTNDYIHVHSPGTGADNPLRSFFSLTVLFSQ